MLVFNGVCSTIQNLWPQWDQAGLFDIPVLSNLFAAVVDFFWGLFGCDRS